MSVALLRLYADLQRRPVGEYVIRGFICLGVVGVLLLLGERSYEFVRYLIEAVSYPFSLNYGEGIVWQQATLIPSKLMYGNIDRYPYIVFHYPPLYHLVVRAVHLLTDLPYLQSGRSVSAGSALVTSALIGALSYRLARVASLGSAASLIGALIAALVPSTFRPEIFWAPLFRVDMLAGALTLAGLVLAEQSIRHPRMVFGAVAAFVAAVYTKQTEIAAPVAAMGVLALVCRRTAITAIIVGLAVALTGLAILELKTNGGFLLHIVRYNENALRARNMWRIFQLQEDQGVYLGLAFLGVYLVWRSWIRQRKLDILDLPRGMGRGWPVFSAMMSAYFALATLMLVTTAKNGSDVNYLLDWMSAGAVFIGFTASYGLSRAFDSSVADYPFMLLLLVAFTGQVIALPAAKLRQSHDSELRQRLAQLTELVHQAKKPVLSDVMVLLMKAGKQVPVEPAIFKELITAGLWDERRELDMVRSRFFAFVIVFPSMPFYTPAVAEAIRSSYPVAVELDDYVVVRFPAGDSSEGRQ